jgi:hypothetical protein
LEVATLSRSSLLLRFGRSLMAGPPTRSCNSTSIGQHKKSLSRSSALNWGKAKVPMLSCLRSRKK